MAEKRRVETLPKAQTPGAPHQCKDGIASRRSPSRNAYRKPAAKGEPKAQKPDVKLSKDVIVGHRQGMRAPLEQLAKEDGREEAVRVDFNSQARRLEWLHGEKAKRG